MWISRFSKQDPEIRGKLGLQSTRGKGDTKLVSISTDSSLATAVFVVHTAVFGTCTAVFQLTGTGVPAEYLPSTYRVPPAALLIFFTRDAPKRISTSLDAIRIC